MVGAGAVSQRVHLPVLACMPNARVAWITDSNDEMARETADSCRLRHVPLPASAHELPDCDAVLLATPVHARATYCQAMAERGVAVFAEKPFAITLEEHLRLEGLFPRPGIACGFVRRMYASTMLLRRILMENWFGVPRRLRLSEGSQVTKTGFDTTNKDQDHRRGGGITLNIGCHLIDLALHLTGARSYSITEQEIVWDGPCDRRLWASVLLKDIHGREGENCELDLTVSWLDRLDNQIEVEFDRVKLCAGIVPEAEVRLRPPASSGSGAVLTVPNAGALNFYQAFYLEWEHFLRGLEEGVPSLISASSSRLTTQMAEQLLQEADGR